MLGGPRLRTAVITALAALAAASSAHAATFTVTSNADSGAGSLRQAITDANANAGADTITFSAGHVITLASALPAVTDPVTIDGGTTGCASVPLGVQLTGVGAEFDGLTLAAGAAGSTVCRLAIRGFGTAQPHDGVVVEADGVTLTGNRIGMDWAGTADGSTGSGIRVQDADDATIGGDVAQERNVISANDTGVVFLGAGGGHHVTGNRIGTDLAGDAALGSQDTGVLASSATMSVRVGGTAAGEENVVSGNTVTGVQIADGEVLGNLIGTSANGLNAVPNGNQGVYVTGPAVTVGGTTPESGNLISGNGTYGIFVIAPTTIQGNVVGPDLTGATALAGTSQDHGITVRQGADGTLIGGSSTSGAGNTISGNLANGVEVSGVITGVSAVAIRGNRIGTSTDGLTAVPNDTGVHVAGIATGTIIGGTGAGEGNLISGNTNGTFLGNGIYVLGASTLIQGNTIGLGATGLAVANDRGIRVGSAANDTIVGGTTAGAGNVISGNDTDPSKSDGILVEGGSTDTTIQGNTVGLDPSGLLARPNNIGIVVAKSTRTTIGGGAPGAGNVISGNDRIGVEIGNILSQDPVVQGNLIGTDATGLLDLGNGQQGVFLTNATGAKIGGTGAGEGNVIAHNGFEGIDAGHGSGTLLGASFLGNRIFDNGAGDPNRIGIDLEGAPGPDANDPGDVDDETVPNRGQNFPVLTSAVTDGTQSAVAGTIDTTPGRAVRVEIFSSAACDPSGFGQAEVLLGAHELTAGSGPTAFTAAVAGTSAGRAVTATATDLTTGDTSELSACATAVAGTPFPAPPAPGAAPSAPAPAPPTPVTGTAVPVVTPKFPAKLRVLRAGVVDGQLDMLLDITSRAVTSGAKLSFDYHAAGKHTTFTVPITSSASRSSGEPRARAAEQQIKVLYKLPSSQSKLDTGIVTVTYAGNDVVAPDEVRLRAASGKAKLVRKTTKIEAGRLVVDGTITSLAKGVVRVRLHYDKADGSAGFLSWNATIAKGKWAISETLPAEASRGGQLSIQFTGYLPEELRGEQTAKQVLA